MSALDAPLRKAARTLLKKFGAPVTVTLVDKTGEYNTAAGSEPKAPTVISTFALETPVRGGFSPQKMADGGGGIARNTKWLLPALDFPVRGPRKDDTVKRVGVEYRIADGLEHSTGELVGLYEIRVMR